VTLFSRFPASHLSLASALAFGFLTLAAAGWQRSHADRGELAPAQLELAGQFEDLFAWVAEQVRPAVVAIDTTDASAEGAAADPEAPPHSSFGSGFIIESRGYIVTNHHLVSEAQAIRVKLAGGEEYAGVVVRSDPTADIALVKIEANDLPVARLGDSEALRVGQWALAVGHPFGLMQTVSAGIVSALKRQDLHLLPFENFIQTDASINPGNSGGPLVNLRGEVVGINTAIYSSAGSMNHGISFAVPINLAKVLAERWIEGKGVGFLGLAPGGVDADMARYFGLEERRGAFVKHVDRGGPAEAGGICPMDLIVKFGAEEVSDENHLRILIAREAPGREIDVEVRRGKDTKLLKIVLRASDEPPPAAEPTAARGQRSNRLLGITVTTLTESLREEIGAVPRQRGVAVIRVERESSAWRKGMRPGDVIAGVDGEEVHDLVELEKALDRCGEVVVFQVLRKGRDIGFFFVPRPRARAGEK
jgi:serine protease Do